METKQKQHTAVDVTGDGSKVWYCKEEYCIGTWNVRSINQGKLEVDKQEMARVNIDILGISKLKWTGMDEFNFQFSCSVVSDSATPWTAAHQASLSITNSQSLSKLMSIESVMQSNHVILCRPLLLLPSIFPSIKVFSNESAFCIRWPKYWNFSLSISPSNGYSGLISGLTGLIPLLSKGLWRVFFSTKIQKHQFFGIQPSLWSSSHIHTWLLKKP